MNFSKISAFIFFLLLFSIQIFPQRLEWEHLVYNDDTLVTRDMAMTPEGDAVLAGNFRVGIYLVNGFLFSNGATDGLITKYDKDGNVLWAKQLGGTGEAFCTSVSVDKEGNVFAAGNFSGSLTIGPRKLTAANYDQYDIFIAEFDKDGNPLWLRKAGGSNSGVPRISADYNGGCYVSGFSGYNDTQSFGGTPVYGSFAARYDSMGNFLWVRNITAGDVSADLAGNLYVSGSFSGTVLFGSTSLASKGAGDIFTAKYDKGGNLLWVKSAGGTGSDMGNSVSACPEGGCYITGGFSGSADFGTAQIVSSGSTDIFIAKYDKDGSLLWAKAAGGSAEDYGTAVSTDKDDRCFVTGNFSQTSKFTNTQITSKGSSDVFISKYDKDGNFIWVNQAGSSLGDYAKAIAADGSGSCYSIYGFAAGNESYDKYTYLGKFSDASITLLSPTGGEQWRIGTRQAVSWTTNLDKVMIQLSTNGGSSWVDLNPSPVDAKLGSYSLAVPNRPSAACKVRIYSPDYPETLADTSGTFTITNSAVPAISITSPNGPEKWLNGTEHNITWTSSLTGSELSIEYSKDGGNSWNLISGKAAADQGSFRWTVPNDTSAQCRIRIKDNSSSTAYDISDNLFKVIPRPVFIYPGKASDTLRIATYRNITWSAPLLKNIDLFYSLNKGISWIKINNNYNETVDAANGSYGWFIPAVTTSDSCRLKIADAEDTTVAGQTSYLFTIYNPLRVTYPKAGDTLQAGNFYDVTWTSDGIRTIKIEYSVLGPASCYIKFPPPGDYCDTLLVREDVRSLPYNAAPGVYTWIVPDNASKKTRLKILDAENPLVYNETETFVITPMPSPDSLLAVFTSTAVKLSWKDKTDYEEGFKVERKEGSGSYTEIGKVEMNVTTYTDNTIDPKNVQSYSYRVRAFNNYASSPYTEISLNPTSVKEENKFPAEYALGQNYPNPFNPSTIISYSLPKESSVKLVIFNELGETVGELLHGIKPAGYHELSFSASGLASGLYFYSIEASSIDGKDSFRQVKKMLLVK